MFRLLLTTILCISLFGCSRASVVTITEDGTTTNVSAWAFLSKIDAAIFSAKTETQQGENYWKSSSGSAVEGVDTASGANALFRTFMEMAIEWGKMQAGMPPISMITIDPVNDRVLIPNPQMNRRLER